MSDIAASTGAIRTSGTTKLAVTMRPWTPSPEAAKTRLGITSVVAKACVTAMTFADAGSDCKRFEGPENEMLFVKNNSDCRNDECKSLKSKVNEMKTKVMDLERDKARLLLRGFTGDMERTACCLVLHSENVDRNLWNQYPTFSKLGTCRLLADPLDAQLKAKRLVAKWWNPTAYRDDMSEVDLGKDVLHTFYDQRKQGNAIAHPMFKEVDARHLVSLAKVARGDEAKTAWPIFISRKRMLRHIQRSVRVDDIPLFENKGAAYGEVVDIETFALDENLQQFEVDLYQQKEDNELNST